jgi:hypothetical protein
MQTFFVLYHHELSSILILPAHPNLMVPGSFYVVYSFAWKVPINGMFTVEVVGHLVLLLEAYLNCSYAVLISAHSLLG